jgi:pilus assembly protein CpaD
MMRCKLGFVLLATALAGCSHVPQDEPSRGVSAVNVPVLTRSEFVFDAAAPDGSLSPTESARLDGWFSSLGVGYGDSIYVDGAYAGAARDDIAQVAGRYGLLLSNGAPITAGAVAPGTVRVIVSRARAEVPNCPNWSEKSQPNFANKSMSNFGCGVNSNLAAMVANPEDLIHGRDGGSVVDAMTSSKAVRSYRSATPTGTEGLKDISTKKKD